MSSVRSILKHFVAREQGEGVGARVRRSIGTMGMRNFTPFLMLDHFNVLPEAGFPDHPHRGQETITYMLHGEMAHNDFTGAWGVIRPGDLQFMTAGRGVVHAEMPVPNADGLLVTGMQLWVDLPKLLKACEPRYRDLRSKEIPIAKPNDKVSVKVISGELYGVKSVQDLAYTQVEYYDFTVLPGGEFVQAVPKGFNAFLYLMEGELEVNLTLLPEFSAAFFKQDGDTIRGTVPPSSTKDARFVLVSGEAHDQPIVQHGPFVETSREKIYEAFLDYQYGTNGFERLKGWQSKIGGGVTKQLRAQMEADEQKLAEGKTAKDEL